VWANGDLLDAARPLAAGFSHREVNSAILRYIKADRTGTVQYSF